MWQLDNRTPFAAERAWVRDRDGAEIWLVAVRCAFDIAEDGSTAPAAEQPPVVLAPEFADPAAPVRSSLRHDTDLPRTKCSTDIVLLADAHAPGGARVTSLEVGFRVGPVSKRLLVTGDRVWQGGQPSEPQPFVTMPICYERAWGGLDPGAQGSANPQWDMRNPAGTGFASSSAHAEGLRLPNVEYPEQRVRAWNDRPAPAGFGPLPVHWQPRLGLAGTYDARWMQERQPLLPADFDDRHYQCAPVDQQAPQFLVGGEPVVLINLAAQSQMRFALPRVALALETSFSDGSQVDHERPRLHTVVLEPTLRRLSLVWHSALPCHPKVHKLMRTRLVRKRQLRWGEDEPESALEA